ncbi:hypothetical protein TEA_007176 [Camellia sinensis var. sinensis]|uniref:Uncharacterized protein n=1 Tax=Camellia sinensis var. sinensis TaxID=542762 RepID=A0A4V3WND1_CAMSN|nr:hypothetical protein TEA_007176 [Camellia sinensis var. sinensis]
MGKLEMPPILIAPGLLASETVCYPSNRITTIGIWLNEDPMTYALPAFIIQTMLILLVTRLLMFILKPFHQPRVFCEFIAGIILGPSVLGQSELFRKKMFDKVSLQLLETMANVGAIYFVFKIGLEMDLSTIRKNGKKALAFASVDAIGVHPTFGAFVFGLIVPNGPLTITLVEKLEDFVMSCQIPLFFAISGLKTNLSKVLEASTWFILILVIILSFASKVAGTVLVAFFYEAPFREGVALGLLMNTKGLIGLIALNLGKDQKTIDDTAYAIMVITTIFMNAIITPILVKIYSPARKFVPYKRRTIQKTKADSELRILACIHTPQNVPTIINLLEASHPTKKSPISIFSLHLVELTGHASTTLIVHSCKKFETTTLNKMQAQSDNIIHEFEIFRHHTNSVYVQSFTTISPYSTMHEEICNLAEDKHAAFIIIPFHKQQMVNGAMEAPNPKFQMVNRNVLANAPCSVGILIDRGLSGLIRLPSGQVSHNIVVLFFGGPHDREALSFAVRMSEHPRNSLTVIRFLPGLEVVDRTVDPSHDDIKNLEILSLEIDKEKDKQLDDDYIKELRILKENDESYSYKQKVVNNGEETMEAIRSVDKIHDLFIVGRGDGIESTLTAGLNEWNECPELGVIGDLLGSSDFAATSSILVVQQYIGLGPHDGGILTPDSMSQQEEQSIMNSTVRS